MSLSFSFLVITLFGIFYNQIFTDNKNRLSEFLKYILPCSSLLFFITVLPSILLLYFKYDYISSSSSLNDYSYFFYIFGFIIGFLVVLLNIVEKKDYSRIFLFLYGYFLICFSFYIAITQQTINNTFLTVDMSIFPVLLYYFNFLLLFNIFTILGFLLAIICFSSPKTKEK